MFCRAIIRRKEQHMEPVLFYGVPKGCSFGSIVALEWLGQPYRLCRIDMLRDMQGDLYGRFNRMRKTPVLLLENGRTLTESVAILHNIAARDLGKGLGFAQGTPDYDRLNQALAFLSTSYFAAFGPLWQAYKMEGDLPVQEMLRSVGREDVKKAHEHLDAMLADREWMAGSSRTVADAYFIGLARWATYHKVLDLKDYPNVWRLVQKLEADPAVAFAHAIEAETPAVSTGRFLGHVTLEELSPKLAA